MAGQITTLDAIVRAELAIEIMNQARGLVSERVAEIEAKGDAAYSGLVWSLLNTQQFIFVQ